MLRRPLCLALVMVGVSARLATAGVLAPVRGPRLAGRQSTLYSQVSHPSGEGVAAQDFEAAYDSYDCSVADDFVVTWIDGWWIDGFHTPGSYNAGGGPVSSMEYKAFNDGGGFPGAQICSGSGTVWTDVDGDVVWLLPDSCMVVPASVPATFWVAVAARMDFAAAGQWYVSTESVTTGNVAKWFNPGDGFGMGCTSWSSCDVTVVNAASLDMSYELLTFLLDPVDLQSLQVE